MGCQIFDQQIYPYPHHVQWGANFMTNVTDLMKREGQEDDDDDDDDGSIMLESIMKWGRKGGSKDCVCTKAHFVFNASEDRLASSANS